jgi:hypothetical protein
MYAGRAALKAHALSSEGRGITRYHGTLLCDFNSFHFQQVGQRNTLTAQASYAPDAWQDE